MGPPTPQASKPWPSSYPREQGEEEASEEKGEGLETALEEKAAEGTEG